MIDGLIEQRDMLSSMVMRGPDSDGARLLRCVQTGGLDPLDDAHDWTPARVDAFLETASYHRLDALVADLAGREPAPAALVEPLRRLRTSLAVRHVALQQDAAFVARVLDGAHIPWVVMKGPVTAHRHHARRQQRSFSDLDVLVAPEDFEAVIGALVGAGAYLADRNWPLIELLACGELNLLLPFGTPLDLHWDLLAEAHDRAAFQVDSRSVVRRAVPLTTADGIMVPAIDPVDELLHLCLHAVVGGTNSLGRLRDIALVNLGAFDLDQLVESARAWGVALVVAAALDRAALVFHLAVDETLIRRLAGGSSWISAMRFLGHRYPVTQAPPATRWASHLKLTRASARTSFAYAAEEVVGFALYRLRGPERDLWDASQLQVEVDDARARQGYFQALRASGR